MSTRQFVLNVMHDASRISVPLTEEPKIFGRIAAYVDVALPHERVAKKLFTIQWNTQRQRHEIQVLGAIFPPSINGLTLGQEECRPLSLGDVIAIGPFTMEYTEALLGALDQDVPDGFIEISRTLADEAQIRLAGCDACNTNSLVPFESVLDRFSRFARGGAEYLLRIPLHCRSCGRPMTEKTLVAFNWGWISQFDRSDVR